MMFFLKAFPSIKLVVGVSVLAGGQISPEDSDVHSFGGALPPLTGL